MGVPRPGRLNHDTVVALPPAWSIDLDRFVPIFRWRKWLAPILRPEIDPPSRLSPAVNSSPLGPGATLFLLKRTSQNMGDDAYSWCKPHGSNTRQDQQTIHQTSSLKPSAGSDEPSPVPFVSALGLYSIVGRSAMQRQTIAVKCLAP